MLLPKSGAVGWSLIAKTAFQPCHYVGFTTSTLHRSFPPLRHQGLANSLLPNLSGLDRMAQLVKDHLGKATRH